MSTGGLKLSARFATVAGCLLILSPIPAKNKKPKAPEPSAAAGPFRLTGISWCCYKADNALRGTFENNSAITVSGLTLTFALKHRGTLITSASAGAPAPIAPGGRWAFSADVLPTTGDLNPNMFDRTKVFSIATMTDSVTIWSCGVLLDGRRVCGTDQLAVNPPVFLPWSPEQKSWNQQHGYR